MSLPCCGPGVFGANEICKEATKESGHGVGTNVLADDEVSGDGERVVLGRALPPVAQQHSLGRAGCAGKSGAKIEAGRGNIEWGNARASGQRERLRNRATQEVDGHGGVTRANRLCGKCDLNGA